MAAGRVAGRADQVRVVHRGPLLPAQFMHRLVADRLGITPDEIASGHCAALSRPKELVDMLAGYATTQAGVEQRQS